MAENNGMPLCTMEAYNAIRQNSTELNEEGEFLFIEHLKKAEPDLIKAATELMNTIVSSYDNEIGALFEKAKARQVKQSEIDSLKKAIGDEIYTMILFGYILREKLEQVKFNESFEGQFDFLKDK